MDNEFLIDQAKQSIREAADAFVAGRNVDEWQRAALSLQWALNGLKPVLSKMSQQEWLDRLNRGKEPLTGEKGGQKYRSDEGFRIDRKEDPEFKWPWDDKPLF
ncbi:hypothetical protein [Nonomuraea sp. NPDC050643]|uniref:hypothetical protein n=1 Tax=Nonomuraea sp. NPDC050643 TaxID=3155660 RepID=UPI00340C62C3